MSHAELIAHIREHVQRHLRRRTTSPDSQMQESFLILDGDYCGRRFILDGQEAVWFFAEQKIQLINAQRQLVDTIDVSATLSEQQLQAA